MKQYCLDSIQSPLNWRTIAASATLALPLIVMADQVAPPLVTVTRLSPEQSAKLAPLLSSIKDRAQQRASVDAQTGQLRPQEHDDVQADAMSKTADTARRNAATASLAAQTTGKTIYHPNGAVGQRFDADFLNFARASVSKTGKLDADCVDAHGDHEGASK